MYPMGPLNTFRVGDLHRERRAVSAPPPGPSRPVLIRGPGSKGEEVMRGSEEGAYIVVERDGGGVGSFLLGAILGAGVALLFAPRSGEETRKDIEDRALQLRDAAGDRIRDLQSELEDRMDQARAEIQERVEQVKTAVDSGRAAAKDARHELEEKLERSKSAYRAGVDAARKEVEKGSDGAEGEAASEGA